METKWAAARIARHEKRLTPPPSPKEGEPLYTPTASTGPPKPAEDGGEVEEMKSAAATQRREPFRSRSHRLTESGRMSRDEGVQ